MFFSPAIVDDTASAIPVAYGSLAALDAALVALDFGIAIPLLSAALTSEPHSLVNDICVGLPAAVIAGGTANSPGLADGSIANAPMLYCGGTLSLPVVQSAFNSVPIASTGVTPIHFTIPNPAVQSEVRKAFQDVQRLSGTSISDTATINLKLSEVQSDISLLDSRIDSLEGFDYLYSAETDDTILVSQPVYIKPNGHAGLAKADVIGTELVAGFAVASAAPTFNVSYITKGKITSANWTAVSGSTSLVPGAEYFLSSVSAGMITTTAPTAVGASITPLGSAKSSTVFDIDIELPVLL